MIAVHKEGYHTTMKPHTLLEVQETMKQQQQIYFFTINNSN